MTDEEIEDMNFKQYLEARYYEALFTEFETRLFADTTEDDNGF
jgi:hypothetical protein